MKDDIEVALIYLYSSPFREVVELFMTPLGGVDSGSHLWRPPLSFPSFSLFTGTVCSRLRPVEISGPVRFGLRQPGVVQVCLCSGTLRAGD
jgi:hypothetical protein